MKRKKSPPRNTVRSFAEEYSIGVTQAFAAPLRPSAPPVPTLKACAAALAVIRDFAVYCSACAKVVDLACSAPVACPVRNGDGMALGYPGDPRRATFLTLLTPPKKTKKRKARR